MNWLFLAILSSLIVSGQSIKGKIVDPIPLPWANVPVGLLPVGADWVSKSTHTDANGVFQFSSIESGDYVVLLRDSAFRGQVRVVHVSREEADLGTLSPKLFTGCASPIGNCNTVGTPSLPEGPVVDLCEALMSPDRQAGTIVVMVGSLTTLHGWPVLTENCDRALSSSGFKWTSAVLLPEGAAPRESPSFPAIRDLKNKLTERAATVRRTSDSAGARIVAVYGFLDIPEGLTVVPCAGESCTRPDILMPPASFLRVDGFQELK